MNKKLIPVSNFNVTQYLGTWYEIARYPFRFEKDLYQVTAEYTLNTQGKIIVTNRGIKNGKVFTAKGRAIIAQRSDVGYLRVSFFGPFFADYRILALDDNYQVAVVASSQKNIWILARTPIIASELLEAQLIIAEKFGFNRSTFFFTPQ